MSISNKLGQGHPLTVYEKAASKIKKRASSGVTFSVQCSVMGSDEVHGLTGVTFRWVPTAAPSGCCWTDLSRLQHLPTPTSQSLHTLTSRGHDEILVSSRDRSAQHAWLMWGEWNRNSQSSYRCTIKDEWCFLNESSFSARFQIKGSECKKKFLKVTDGEYHLAQLF